MRRGYAIDRDFLRHLHRHKRYNGGSTGMTDLLYRGRLEALEINFSFGLTSALVNDAVVRHDCGPASAHVLGRALTAGVLCSATLNSNERLNLRWQYEGHLKTVLVDAGGDVTVRGFVSPKDLSRYEGGAAEVYGEQGRLTAVKSSEGDVLNHGTSDALRRDVIEDLAFYFSVSDQIETGMSIMIGFNADPDQPVSLCQGMMIQALPGCDLETFEKLRGRLERSDGCRLLMARASDADSHLETVINELTKDICARPGLFFEACGTPRFQCNCEREKMGAVLRTLPYGERMSMVKDKEDVTISCQFCNTRYVLTIDECIRAWNNQPL